MRLVVVSNRVPGPNERVAAAGGLAITLQESLKDDVLWLGWSGEVSAQPSYQPRNYCLRKLTCRTLSISQEEHRRFYLGFSNSTLWPLFHFRLGLVEYRREDFEGYLGVNKRFADLVSATVASDDLVWVHDYHFLSLAAQMKGKSRPRAMGFFLHTPFPPPSVFEILPCARRLLEDMCAYDVLGFQTGSDLANFSACCSTILGAEVRPNGVISFGGKLSTAVTVPAGIDPKRFEKQAIKAAGSKNTARLRQSLQDRKLVIGVDRLDYSKGLANKFESYARFLDRYPQHRRRVSFLQVAVRSRSEVTQYQALKRELDRLCGKINGRFAEFDWVPLRYMTRSLPRQMLAGFYRFADVGLVTPLRDGMNLVAKEFVAAQDEKSPGVLILSRFAGAAESLKEALLVNPYDPDEIAEALHRALTMSREECVDRSFALKARVRAHSSADWCKLFLEKLRGVGEAHPAVMEDTSNGPGDSPSSVLSASLSEEESRSEVTQVLAKVY